MLSIAFCFCFLQNCHLIAILPTVDFTFFCSYPHFPQKLHPQVLPQDTLGLVYQHLHKHNAVQCARMKILQPIYLAQSLFQLCECIPNQNSNLNILANIQNWMSSNNKIITVFPATNQVKLAAGKVLLI